MERQGRDVRTTPGELYGNRWIFLPCPWVRVGCEWAELQWARGLCTAQQPALALLGSFLLSGLK